MTIVDEGSVALDALTGLWSDPPTLPPRWFYDERGSQLFDEITQLPEYYPMRRETEILTSASSEIAALMDVRTLIELGSGSSIKTRLLLDALSRDRDELTFVPVDVSGDHLEQVGDSLRRAYPDLTVDPCVCDFDRALERLGEWPGPRLLIFLGSTIGNLTPEQRHQFLDRVSTALQPDDHFLLGADLIKAPSRLTAAYDDAAGVTAAFNRNMIEVLRRELDAVGLYPDDFEHVVRWRPTHHRIEMWLRARRPVHAYFKVLDREWELDAGSEILTEISTKFNIGELHDELASSGLVVDRTWTDGAKDYSLTLAHRPGTHTSTVSP